MANAIILPTAKHAELQLPYAGSSMQFGGKLSQSSKDSKAKRPAFLQTIDDKIAT